MSLSEFVDSLEKKKQFQLAIELLERTLPIWDNYASQNKLEYTDSVVGMHHVVKRDILDRTLKTAKKEALRKIFFKKQLKILIEEYSDPMISIQDLDWELPYHVDRTFCAFYNLLDCLNGKTETVFNEKTIYVVINQAIDALVSAQILSQKDIDSILLSYKNNTY